MRVVTLPGGETVPALGQGTWRMGEVASERAREVRALRYGLDLGMTLIDTAEMYGDGGAEAVVGEAIRGHRDRVFVVSKVYPHNASRTGVPAACERSLKRLGVDRLDLYLLHWRGQVPLAETVEAFERLRERGLIRHWGVSNLDTDDMDELWLVPHGERCATNQLLYNLQRRGIEWDLLPKLAARAVPVMAYSPIEQSRLAKGGALASVAQRHGVEPYTVALAWVMRRPDVIAIPKSVRPEHLDANRRAVDLVLDEADLAALDGTFPPPKRAQALEMI